jgi:hypothetical protein
LHNIQSGVTKSAIVSQVINKFVKNHDNGVWYEEIVLKKLVKVKFDYDLESIATEDASSTRSRPTTDQGPHPAQHQLARGETAVARLPGQKAASVPIQDPDPAVPAHDPVVFIERDRFGIKNRRFDCYAIAAIPLLATIHANLPTSLLSNDDINKYLNQVDSSSVLLLCQVSYSIFQITDKTASPAARNIYLSKMMAFLDGRFTGRSQEDCAQFLGQALDASPALISAVQIRHSVLKVSYFRKTEITPILVF